MGLVDRLDLEQEGKSGVRNVSWVLHLKSWVIPFTEVNKK